MSELLQLDKLFKVNGQGWTIFSVVGLYFVWKIMQVVKEIVNKKKLNGTAVLDTSKSNGTGRFDKAIDRHTEVCELQREVARGKLINEVNKTIKFEVSTIHTRLDDVLNGRN